MNNFNQKCVFVLVAVLTGIAFQCASPTIENVIDAGLDAWESGINDARADVSIPENCNCEDPIIDIDERLSALESSLSSNDFQEVIERVGELESQLDAFSTSPDKFYFTVTYNGGIEHDIDTPGSWLNVVDYSVVPIGEINFVSGKTIFISGYDIDHMVNIIINIQIPDTIPLDTPTAIDSLPYVQISATPLMNSTCTYGDNPNTCGISQTGKCGVTSGSIDGSITVTRRDDRFKATFNADITGPESICTLSIKNGSFDALVSREAHRTRGEYSAP